MPTEVKVTGYTLAEIETAHPEAFERIHDRWRDLVYRDQAPWADETMDSLRAVIDAAGGSLDDWSIGPDSGSCSVGIDDHYTYHNASGEHSAPCGARWFRREVLAPLGYVRPDGRAYFPGLCKLTGYYADDAFLEDAYRSLRKGETLREALEGLAHVASRMMADDLEQQAGRDGMFANWGDRLFDEHGDPVKVRVSDRAA